MPVKKKGMTDGVRLYIAFTSAFISLVGVWGAALADTPPVGGASAAASIQEQQDLPLSTGGDSYIHLYQKYCELQPGDTITVDAGDMTVSDGVRRQTEDGTEGVRLGATGSWAEVQITVPKTGRYAVNMLYYNLPGSARPIEFSLLLDGRAPYTEMELLTLPRIWQDVKDEAAGTDEMENERLPETEEHNGWNHIWLWDSQGLYDQPYYLHLTEGIHTLRISAINDEFLLGGMELGVPAEPETYAAYKKRFRDQADYASGTRVIQAEQYSTKNSNQIYSGSDRVDAATSPNSPDGKKINTIGGTNWKYAGQELSWEIETEESGFYALELRYRQNLNQGMPSYRTLLIDGEIPFREAANLVFDYSLDWTVKTLGDKQPYRFYLKEGKHTVTLRTAPGAFCSVLRDAKQAVLDMTQIYRSIVMITGSDPDIYRDYSLEKQIPALKESLEDIAKRFERISEDIAAVAGTKGTMASGVDETAMFFRELIRSMYQIPERIGRFSERIEAMGSLLLQLSEQPLELDCFAFVPDGGEPLRETAGFFEQLWFSTKRYIHSFLADYNSIGSGDGKGGKYIHTWVSSGRDQAQILENMILAEFSAQTGIGVKLSLVDTNQVLINATLAGKGPDVALMVNSELPVNLAMRGALIDLSRFDLKQAEQEIQKNAWNPYLYNGGIYAIPETQVFDMLFYRTDIFADLHIDPPSTWEEFYETLNILQQNNLQVAIPETDSSQPGVSVGIATFNKFLYQSGESYFNEDLSATRFDSPKAVEAFEKWTELYTRYSLEREVNFYNRFRIGEVAMGIQPYTMYNQLMAAAPEIKGLWAMVPVPGTPQEDGSVNRSQTATGTSSILLKSCEKKGIADEAFAFISWWTGQDAQARYGNSLESVMGVAARYTPANQIAFSRLNWSNAEARMLSGQWEWVTATPQIPGSYYINRAISSAFRTTVDEKLDARRQLLIFNKDINDEIARKRDEFGLGRQEGDR